MSEETHQIDKVVIPDCEPDGQFDSFHQWVCRATDFIGGTNALCVDTKNRICTCGKDFMRARDEGSFPVRFYFEAGPRRTAVQIRKDDRAYQKALRRDYPWRYR